MKRSESIVNLGQALIELRKAVGKIPKDSTNQFYTHHKYASLGKILDKIEDAMEKNGLSVLQIPDGDGLFSIVVHMPTNEFMEATYEIHPASNTPQAMGSAITYGRRYALVTILGLKIEDDDGNEGSGVENKKGKGRQQSGAQQGALPLQNTGRENQGGPSAAAAKRPWLQEAEFQAAIKRIQAGEENVIQNLEIFFMINNRYKPMLADAEKIRIKNLKK